MNEPRLVFVYNAGSDVFSTVTDFAHKIFSPSTYQCSLCALTYGNFSMKEEWKEFINSLQVPPVFLHKDEFEKQYKLNKALPVVFIKTGDELQQLISKHEIDKCATLQQLKEIVLLKLSQYDKRNHSNI